jgi:hypothetical protein
MGMFDTIIFDRPIPCAKCGAEIRSDQTKAFECTLDEYRIGDCIAHAEESRIVRDELFCWQCKEFTGTHYYLAVYRGILVGIEQEREAAEALLRSFSFEKLLLWYHDLYRQRERARRNPPRRDVHAQRLRVARGRLHYRTLFGSVPQLLLLERHHLFLICG